MAAVSCNCIIVRLQRTGSRSCTSCATSPTRACRTSTSRWRDTRTSTSGTRGRAACQAEPGRRSRPQRYVTRDFYIGHSWASVVSVGTRTEESSSEVTLCVVTNNTLLLTTCVNASGCCELFCEYIFVVIFAMS